MPTSTMATPFSNNDTFVAFIQQYLGVGNHVRLPAVNKRHQNVAILSKVKSRPMPILANETQIAPSQYKQFVITLLIHLR